MTMIRPARAIDVPEIVAMMVARFPETRFASVPGAAIDEVHARKWLAQMTFRHGNTNLGGCFLAVAEQDGRIEAFICGVLVRVYAVGNLLCSQDLYLLSRPDTDARTAAVATNRLLDAYCDWAASNPRVIEINTSWTDILPTGEQMDAVYLRKGFTRCGAMYRRTVDREARKAA